ncbi:MAG: GNAT family N-acetyltransferase [Pseudomonadota bacterium]|nr:GNAT family N-acetyltransferase [Pseudomonadota bacterium]
MAIPFKHRLSTLKPIQLTRPGQFLFRSWAHLYRSRFPYQELAPLTTIAQSLSAEEARIHGLLDNHSKQWAGFTYLEFYSSSVLLAYLAISPDFEEQGLARRLVDEQVETCLSTSTPYFWLEANPKLWSFYNKLGFQRIPIPYYIPEFYGKGTEFMGLFIKTHPSVKVVSKQVVEKFVSQLFLKGYGIQDSDPRYQKQMALIQTYPQVEFKIEDRY